MLRVLFSAAALLLSAKYATTPPGLTIGVVVDLPSAEIRSVTVPSSDVGLSSIVLAPGQRLLLMPIDSEIASTVRQAVGRQPPNFTKLTVASLRETLR